MGLNVYLKNADRVKTPCPYCDGTGVDMCEEYLFDASVTHNLTPIADEAGIYEALWRPEEAGIKVASQLIPILRDGLNKLKESPEKFKTLDPKNGWGSYDIFVPWVERYLRACEENPNAEVRACR